MKRPIVTSVAIIALLGGGLYLGWQYRDKSLSDTGQNLGGAAARAAIISNFDLKLPASAGEISYCEDAVDKTRLVYAAFDVPALELQPLLDSSGDYPRFPATTELKDDTNLLQTLIQMSDAERRAWWKPAELRQALCGQKLGRRNTGAAAVKWRLVICVAPRNEQISRVYLAFSEEPAGVEEK